MPPLTVGELQVVLSGDLSRLDRDMDRIDNRAGATEKKHTAAWQRTAVNAGQAITKGMLAAERDADKIGVRTGGTLSRGINQGLIRNSPLIAAAIGGALVAGAPLVMAGAAAMFAGVGAAAAAQTVEVRSAWTQLGKDIRDGAVADAAVLVPVYVDMAEQIGDAFEDMRPQLREAFADSAPLIQSTTDGIIALGSNAMPGLVRAIAAGGPVFDGLEDFLGSVGDGITGLLDGISSHGPAAGTAFSSLGDIVGDLLPILGELLGQGAELAADVLPAVAAATGLTLDVLQLLGPLLPTIVTGFIAFKAAKTAAGYLDTFGQKLAFASYNGGALAGTAGKLSTAVSGLGKGLPVMAAAFGLASAQMAAQEQKVQDWTRAILDGGKAALTASQQASQAASGFNEFVDSMQFGDQESPFEAMFGSDDEERFAEAEAAARALYDAMSPLEQAGQDVTKATNDLSLAVDTYGKGSPQAAAAADVLTGAQERQERVNGELEMAIEGVTSAMIAQADQAMASLDSGFAYRNSVDQLEDAQAALNTAIKENGAGSEEAARAQLALEEQNYRTALSYGQQQADLSGLSKDSLEYKRIVQEQMLGELMRLRDAAGPEMKAALQAQIDALQAAGVTLGNTAAAAGGTAQKMRDLGLSVTEIPGQKFVKVEAPTAEQKQRLEALGYTVTTLPNGDIYVSADTAAAEAALAKLERDRFARVYINEVITNRAGSTYDQAGGGRAAGGPVSAGVPYLVGEGGREMFVPDTPGWIATARQTAEMLAGGNQRAAAMLPALTGGGSSAGTGRANVGGVTKIYNLHAAVTHTLTLREFMRLQQEADALHG